MLEIARKKARSCGITTIEFVQGSIDDLSGFGNDDFDLVLCLDSPLSLCYNTYETALSELVRVTRSRLVLCVMNRLGVIPEGVDFDLKHFGKLKTVLEVYDTGTLVVTEKPEKLKGLQLTLFPSWHAFTKRNQGIAGENGVSSGENFCSWHIKPFCRAGSSKASHR